MRSFVGLLLPGELAQSASQHELNRLWKKRSRSTIERRPQENSARPSARRGSGHEVRKTHQAKGGGKQEKTAQAGSRLPAPRAPAKPAPALTPPSTPARSKGQQTTKPLPPGAAAPDPGAAVSRRSRLPAKPPRRSRSRSRTPEGRRSRSRLPARAALPIPPKAVPATGGSRSRHRRLSIPPQAFLAGAQGALWRADSEENSAMV